MVSMDSGAGTTLPTHLWSLREDVLVEDDPEQGRIVVVTRWGEFTIDGVDDLVRDSLRRMSLGPVSLENAVADSPPVDADVLGPMGSGDHASGDRPDLVHLRQVLDLLSDCVVRSLGPGDGDTPLLSAIPVARFASLRLTDVAPDRPIRLSRFAAIRSADGDLLVESPLAQYHVLLLRQVAALVITALGKPSTINEVAARLGVQQAVVAGIVGYLVGSGMVLVDDPKSSTPAQFAEDSDPVLLQWPHHDLLFHSRSRMGRYGGQSGAVFPFAGQLPSPDLVKPVRSGTRLALYRPSIDELTRNDPSLTDLLENPRMCADLTDRKLSAQQVGELLFRAARIRSVASGSAGTGIRYEISDRPYLSVSGLYELEMYISAHKCDMPRGTYHYDPQRHELTLVNDSELELDELLDGARVAARTSWKPPLLITFTARVARTSWMYGGIGYSLALTHMGALQQTLCLVANAMGLAACAPAVDPGDATNNALRLEWPAEVGVGELLVS
jgi:SagB-type dehydrogenase family enzyme